eukprot:g33241.t1
MLALDIVQMRFTRLILDVKGLSYEERLSRLGLYLLEYGKMRVTSLKHTRFLGDLTGVQIKDMCFELTRMFIEQHAVEDMPLSYFHF